MRFVNQHGADRVEVLATVETLLDLGHQYFTSLEASTAEVSLPITGGVRTESELIRALQSIDISDIVQPMNIEYIHFLHRILMMGIAPPGQCGNYRKKPVTVDNPDLWFPPPDAVPPLMLEYCGDFRYWNSTEKGSGSSKPDIARNFAELSGASNQLRTGEQVVAVPPEVANQIGAIFEKALPSLVDSVTFKDNDTILTAARVSHQFVCIHPYKDGNGRVSRLLMKLALCREHPPVYLKADNNGRHRYFYALQRADRGDLNPLACLICSNLIEIYAKIVKSLGTVVR